MGTAGLPDSRSHPGLTLVETPVHQAPFAGADSKEVAAPPWAAEVVAEPCMGSEMAQPTCLSVLALLVACRVILPALPAAGLQQEQSTSSLRSGPQGSQGPVFPQPWSRESVRQASAGNFPLKDGGFLGCGYLRKFPCPQELLSDKLHDCCCKFSCGII